MITQKFRLKRGWSQQQLADISGISLRTIQRLEAGAKPSLETLRSLAAVFEVSIEELEADTATAEQAIPPQEALAMKQAGHLREFYLHLVVYSSFARRSSPFSCCCPPNAGGPGCCWGSSGVLAYRSTRSGRSCWAVRGSGARSSDGLADPYKTSFPGGASGRGWHAIHGCILCPRPQSLFGLVSRRDQATSGIATCLQRGMRV